MLAASQKYEAEAGSVARKSQALEKSESYSLQEYQVDPSRFNPIIGSDELQEMMVVSHTRLTSTQSGV